MKNVKLLALLWVVLVAWTLAWCGNKENSDFGTNNQWDIIVEDVTSQYDAVINYNDSLVEMASQCIISEDNIPEDYENGIENIQVGVNNTIAECQNSINQINELWDWEGDSSLREWIVKILELDVAYFSKFNEILPYLVQGELPEADADKYETLLDEISAINQEMETANNDLMEVQEAFAARHGYELQPEIVEE